MATIKEQIKAEIERIRSFNKTSTFGQINEGESVLSFLDTLQEPPRFKVGDMVISKNNPHLSYKVLKVGLPNELGKLDYEVEIFTDGKTGIRVGNTSKEHKICLVSIDKMDEWGKLMQEPEVDIEKEMDNYFDEHDYEFARDDYLDFARHFFNLGLNAKPKRIWHDESEEPEHNKEFAVVSSDNVMTASYSIVEHGLSYEQIKDLDKVIKWAYVEDLIMED